MDLTAASSFLGDHVRGVLITLRPDGSPQASNIVYTHADGVVRVSVPSRTVKAKNIARDPRVALHVTSADFGSFVVAEGRAELSDVSRAPGDAVGRELLEIYETIRGEPHPDVEEFFDVMASDRRLVIRLAVTRAHGRVD